MKYTKLNETSFEVEHPQEVLKTIYTLNELLNIRASIDVSEAEYLAKSQEEKDKFDALIAQAQILGVKTQEELQPVIEEVVEPIIEEIVEI